MDPDILETCTNDLFNQRWSPTSVLLPNDWGSVPLEELMQYSGPPQTDDFVHNYLLNGDTDNMIPSAGMEIEVPTTIATGIRSIDDPSMAGVVAELADTKILHRYTKKQRKPARKQQKKSSRVKVGQNERPVIVGMYRGAADCFFSGERQNRTILCPTCDGEGHLVGLKAPVGEEEGEKWERLLQECNLLKADWKAVVGAASRPAMPTFVKKKVEEGTETLLMQSGGTLGSSQREELIQSLYEKCKYNKDSIGQYVDKLLRGTSSAPQGHLLLEPSLDILAGITDGTDKYLWSRAERYRILYQLQFGFGPPV